MRAEELLVSQLAQIESLIDYVCRRNRLVGADASDFSSWVILNLIENDYAVFRKFEGKSSLATYLMVVIQRLLIDHRAQAWGRWRPSVEARRHGQLGVDFEVLTMRDEKTIDEALQILLQKHGPVVAREELLAISRRLPIRKPRPMEVEDSSLKDMVGADADAIERHLLDGETRSEAIRANEVLGRRLSRMKAEDRLILRMRFKDDVSIANIGRALQVDQKKLYKRVDRLLKMLRSDLELAGIHGARSASALADLEIDFDGIPAEGQDGISH